MLYICSLVGADDEGGMGSGSTKGADGPLPPLAERIQAAKDSAERQRAEAGLPPADDGPYTEEAMKARKRRRKRRPK